MPEQARGTIDIDVNIMVDVRQSELILSSLPEAVTWTTQNLERLIKVGQDTAGYLSQFNALS